MVEAAQLDCPRVHYPRTEVGQLQHLIIAYLVEFPRIRDYPGVRREDPVHVGVDLAAVGAEYDRHCHRRYIAAASTQRSDVKLLGDALKAGDDNYLTVVQLPMDPAGIDRHYARLPERARGLDAGLRSGQRDCRLALRPQRHRHQRARHHLTRREEQVHLSIVRVVGHLMRQIDQVIGRLTHSRNYRDYLGALAMIANDAVRHRHYSLGRRYRRAAIFLDYQRHFEVSCVW